MEQIDHTTAQSVWNRVLEGHESPTKTLPDILADYTNATRQAQFTYGQLFRLARGSLRKPLLQLMQEEEQQSARLTTLYFLTTGTTLPPGNPQWNGTNCLTKTLQQLYQGSLVRRESYLQSASQYPYLGNFFRQLSTGQSKIQDQLMHLVQQRLG